jgi:Tol biopolymer transport system component/thiol-disulfide isomerase/thioredoxin
MARNQQVQPTADALLAAAIKQAQVEKKQVFLEFGASWCAPCQRLLHFLEAPEMRPTIAKYFVVVSVTVSERGDKAVMNTPRGDALMRKLGGNGGIPFIAFLDAQGNKLGDDELVGFAAPEDLNGVTAWVDLLRRMAPTMAPSDRSRMIEHLSNYATRLGWVNASRRIVWRMTDDEWAWAGPPSVSPDQRYFAVPDEFTRAILVRDARTNVTRKLTDDDPTYVSRAAFARSGYQLAYACGEQLRPRQICILDLPESGTARPRRLNLPAEYDEAAVYDWTPDGRSVVISVEKSREEGQIGLVSVANGSFQALTAVRPGSTGMAVSPDGRFLAFSSTDTPDVRLIEITTRREVAGLAHPAHEELVGWTSDGQHILFTSNRTGATDLWSAYFRDGRIGAVELLTSDIGSLSLFGLKGSDTVYSLVIPRGTPSRMVVGGIDLATGRVVREPAESVHEFVGTNGGPAWSPDGQSLAYLSRRGHLGLPDVLIVQWIATGNAREFKLPFAATGPLLWAPDGRSVALTGAGSIQRVDVATGTAKQLAADGRFPRVWTVDERLFFNRISRERGVGRRIDIVELDLASGRERLHQEIVNPGAFGAAKLSADGRTIVYLRRSPGSGGRNRDLVERNLQTGAERVLLSPATGSSDLISPDGRHVIATGFDATTKKDVLLLVPTNGDSPRAVPLGEAPAVPTPIAWAPDSSSVLAMVPRAMTSGFRGEYWWIPIDSRLPRKLDLGAEPAYVTGMALASRGGGIAFTLGPGTAPSAPAEIWQLEFTKSGRR